MLENVLDLAHKVGTCTVELGALLRTDRTALLKVSEETRMLVLNSHQAHQLVMCVRKLIFLQCLWLRYLLRLQATNLV